MKVAGRNSKKKDKPKPVAAKGKDTSAKTAKPARSSLREQTQSKLTAETAKSPTAQSLFPENIEPMLATLVNKPVEESGWIYEVKWDGYRAIAYVDNGNVDIRSRNNKSFNE